jgi:hypothetical protein
MKYLKTSPVPHTADAPIESIAVAVDGNPVGTFVVGNPEFVIENDTVYLNYPLDPNVISVGNHSADVTIDNGWEAATVNYPFVRPVLPAFTVFISGS